MYRRQGNRIVANSLALIILSMVIPTMGFVAAGSVDPRVHRVRDCEIDPATFPPEFRCAEQPVIITGGPEASLPGSRILANNPYPLQAVLVSAGLVLAEGLVLALIMMRARPSLAWRALLAGVAAGILAMEMRSAMLGLPSWYGYVTYHFLWLVCAAALMFALVLVGAAEAAFRRFYRAAPANRALQRTALARRR